MSEKEIHSQPQRIVIFKDKNFTLEYQTCMYKGELMFRWNCHTNDLQHGVFLAFDSAKDFIDCLQKIKKGLIDYGFDNIANSFIEIDLFGPTERGQVCSE